MNFLKSTLLLALTSAMVTGCGNTNPKLEAPIETFQPVTVQGGQAAYNIQAQVDILIVVDNSLSMDIHQQNLANNIDKFVSTFSKNALIDYHIGVVPVYDTKSTLDPKKLAKGAKIHPAGHLLPLKGAGENVLFATKDTPNMLETLKATIKMGTQPGPEFEESFSPVLAAVSDDVNKINQGFYRPDAHLAIIFITDADDVTPEMTASEFYRLLLEKKNYDRSKILASGALAIEKTCKRDPGAREKGPEKIMEFLSPKLVAGQPLSLCSPTFGQKLADFGNELTERVGRKSVELPQIPDIDTLKVTYGDQELKRDFLEGWSYDPDANRILLSGKTEIKAQPNAQILVHYTPVNVLNMNNGRVKVAGQKPVPTPTP